MAAAYSRCYPSVLLKIDETHVKPQPGWMEFRPRFEPSTSHIQVYKAYHTPTCSIHTFLTAQQYYKLLVKYSYSPSCISRYIFCLWSASNTFKFWSSLQRQRAHFPFIGNNRSLQSILEKRDGERKEPNLCNHLNPKYGSIYRYDDNLHLNFCTGIVP
jgi:hypothetical protein